MTVESAAPGRHIVERALAVGRRALDEAEAKALFAAYGIPVVEGAPVRSADEAVEEPACAGAAILESNAVRRARDIAQVGDHAIEIESVTPAIGPFHHAGAAEAGAFGKVGLDGEVEHA